MRGRRTEVWPFCYRTLHGAYPPRALNVPRPAYRSKCRGPFGSRPGESRNAQLWGERDPIDLQAARVAELGVDIEALRAEVAGEVDRATEAALAMPMPDPSTATEGVFCEGDAEPLGDGRAPWSGFHTTRGAA